MRYRRPRRPRPGGLRFAAGAAVALWLFAAAVAADDTALHDIARALTLDAARLSLSGVSSGGYMAQQMHVIHSAHVLGVGVLAAGPYRCAAGSYPPWSWFDSTGLYAATSRCSNTNPWWFFQGAPDVHFSLAQTRYEARRGSIDDPAGLRRARVWLLSGSEDETVPRVVVDVLEDYYEHFVRAGALHHERLDGAGHAMITLDHGNACAESGPPFISDCDFDAAGALLAHIHGALQPRASEVPEASLQRFDQRPYFEPGDASVSLGERGYVYVPQRCRDGETCALHVAFHGCRQTLADIDEQFVRHAGYNAWAETNALVVLYPQVVAWAGAAAGVGANPRGCWDWWGYSGPDYHRRHGKQPAAVAEMINTLLGERLLRTRAR